MLHQPILSPFLHIHAHTLSISHSHAFKLMQYLSFSHSLTLSLSRFQTHTLTPFTHAPSQVRTALRVLAPLLYRVGAASVEAAKSRILDPLLALLPHETAATRTHAARCLRAFVRAAPAQVCIYAPCSLSVCVCMRECVHVYFSELIV
jgi:hypothetical protein